MVASRAMERLGTTGMSIGVNGLISPRRRTERSSRSGLRKRQEGRRDDQIFLVATWSNHAWDMGILGANSIDGDGLRPLDAKTPSQPKKVVAATVANRLRVGLGKTSPLGAPPPRDDVVHRTSSRRLSFRRFPPCNLRSERGGTLASPSVRSR